MPVICLASAGGSIGVTTTALGLTLVTSGRSLLVDADLHPAQSVLSGYLRGSVGPSGGLPEFADAVRREQPCSLGDISLQLDDEAWFLPGFAHAGTSRLAGALWAPLARAMREWAATGTVYVDTGRVGPSGIASELVALCDEVAWLAGSSLTAVARDRMYLPIVAEQVANAGVRLRLVVLGPDRPYSAREIARALGVDDPLTLPWDPRGAAQYSDGVTMRRRTPLTTGLTDLASRWANPHVDAVPA